MASTAFEVRHFLSEATVHLPRTARLLGPVRQTAGALAGAALAALPHGGQRSARRNAWSSMVADSTQARLRDEAQVAVDRSLARARRYEARALKRAR